MKIFLLLAIAATGLFATGCRTVAVVADGHRGRSYGVATVSYDQGRPYYYSGRSRVWGYPAGYRGSRTYVAPGRTYRSRAYVAPAPVYRGSRVIYH